jgi:hypothetical protein
MIQRRSGLNNGSEKAAHGFSLYGVIGCAGKDNGLSTIRKVNTAEYGDGVRDANQKLKPMRNSLPA